MVGKSSEAVDVYKKILANQYDDETKEEEETEESAEETEERTEADASGAVSAEKPKKGLWRERLIANAQLVWRQGCGDRGLCDYRPQRYDYIFCG